MSIKSRGALTISCITLQTDKRLRPSPGYFGQLESCKLPRLKRLKPQREILDDEYFVEKLLAKRKKGDETQYLVKWQDWRIEDSTWEPVKHLPPSPVDEFEHPCPAKDRIGRSKRASCSCSGERP